jgi:hypothetical protein
MQLHFNTIHEQNGNVPYSKSRTSEIKHARIPVPNVKIIMIFHSTNSFELYSLIQSSYLQA